MYLFSGMHIPVKAVHVEDIYVWKGLCVMREHTYS